VAFLDLDHFKRVNDTWSHDVGDRVLQAVARLVAHVVVDVEDGIAARMGGEEFLVALPGLEPAMVVRRLEQLRSALRDHPWAALAPGLEVTTSIGVATSLADATERLELLSTADRRLYDAKRAGRDRVVAHD